MIAPDSCRHPISVRRYAKYGKTVIEVGDGPRAYDRVIGHPLEFIPLADPSAAKASSELRMRLDFRGTPLAGALGHAGVAPVSGRHTHADLTLTTSAEGIVSIPLGADGLWNVRAWRSA